MLVLTRKKNESIMLGDDVILSVISISGDKVRLGVEAPRQVAVHRGEVYEAIKAKLAEGQPMTPGKSIRDEEMKGGDK